MWHAGTKTPAHQPLNGLCQGGKTLLEIGLIDTWLGVETDTGTCRGRRIGTDRKAGTGKGTGRKTGCCGQSQGGAKLPPINWVTLGKGLDRPGPRFPLLDTEYVQGEISQSTWPLPTQAPQEVGIWPLPPPPLTSHGRF